MKKAEATLEEIQIQLAEEPFEEADSTTPMHTIDLNKAMEPETFSTAEICEEVLDGVYSFFFAFLSRLNLSNRVKMVITSTGPKIQVQKSFGSRVGNG